MGLSSRDKTIVRDLAQRVAEIAALPIQKEKAELWRRLNGLDPVRPMVMLFSEAWAETVDDSEAECSGGFCREQELELRRLLYQWEHTPGDMVVEDTLFSPVVVHDTGWGVEANPVRPDDRFGSSRFEPVLRSEQDIDNIRIPQVSVDWGQTDRLFDLHCDLYDGVLKVEKRGRCDLGVSMFDMFATWRGLDQAFMDMIDRPKWLHQVLERLTEGELARLTALEQQDALGLNNRVTRKWLGYSGIGCGGLGFTDELPGPDSDGTHVRAKDLWGHATTQIFADVSPAMHEEFALQYEGRYLSRFGLASYGCCEPLHGKVDILRKHVPNLRRISMSPWVDLEAGAAAVGKGAIFSYKPNPAVFAGETWDADRVRMGLRQDLEKTRGCTVEIIMNSVSTCRREPQRLSDWTRIAVELAEEFAY